MFRLSSGIGRSEVNLWNYLKNISLQTGNISSQIELLIIRFIQKVWNTS
jgi:hypothetical protein